jgi:hypothetical protein
MVRKLIIAILYVGAITYCTSSLAAQPKRSPSTNPFANEFDTSRHPSSPPEVTTPLPPEDFTYYVPGTDIVFTSENYDPSLTLTSPTGPFSNSFAPDHTHDQEIDKKHKSSPAPSSRSNSFLLDNPKKPNRTWQGAALTALKSLTGFALLGAAACACYRYTGYPLPMQTQTSSPSTNLTLSKPTLSLKEAGAVALNSVSLLWLGTFGHRKGWLGWLSNMTPWGRKYNEVYKRLDTIIAMSKQQQEADDRHYQQNFEMFRKIMAQVETSHRLNNEISVQLDALEEQVANEKGRAQVLLEICNKLQAKAHELSNQAQSLSTPESIKKHMRHSKRVLVEYVKKLLAEKISQPGKNDT